jgi:spore germination cell wall hydrolase CwlJ-like protein
MGRVRTTGLRWGGLCVALLSAAMLLPQAPEAQAQAAMFPHITKKPVNPAAEVARRQALTLDLAREVECLALNVYFESRGEPLMGKHAVAAVTLNRVAHPDFPDSICRVVLQGVRYGRNRCQFSWACDGHSDRPRDRAAWQRAQQVAYDALFFDQPDPTDGALYFHATRVRPSWARSMVKSRQIGRHIYYRQPMSAENDRGRTRS